MAERKTRNSTTGRNGDGTDGDNLEPIVSGDEFDDGEIREQMDNAEHQLEEDDESQLAQTLQENQIIKTQNTQMKERLTTLQNETSKLRKWVETSEKELCAHQDTINEQRKRISEMSKLHYELKEENDMLTSELERTKELLCDEKALSADLMNRIDDPSTAIEGKASVLLITDRNDPSLRDSVNEIDKWQIEIKSVDSINFLANAISKNTIDLANYDKVVLFLGSSEITANEDGHIVATRLIRTTKLNFKCKWPSYNSCL